MALLLFGSTSTSTPVLNYTHARVPSRPGLFIKYSRWPLLAREHLKLSSIRPRSQHIAVSKGSSAHWTSCLPSLPLSTSSLTRARSLRSAVDACPHRRSPRFRRP